MDSAIAAEAEAEAEGCLVNNNSSTTRLGLHGAKDNSLKSHAYTTRDIVRHLNMIECVARLPVPQWPSSSRPPTIQATHFWSVDIVYITQKLFKMSRQGKSYQYPSL